MAVLELRSKCYVDEKSRMDEFGVCWLRDGGDVVSKLDIIFKDSLPS